MSKPTQAEIFQVLLDRAEEDGGIAVEVRRWIANHLVALRILGPWEAHVNESSGTDTRRALGADRGASWVCHVQLHSRGTEIHTGRPASYYMVNYPNGSSTRAPDAKTARFTADEVAAADGWVCADRPLEQLCRRLRELKEYEGFVEDLETRTTPSKEYQHIYDVHGHDPIVRDCLRQLGFKPRPDTGPTTLKYAGREYVVLRTISGESTVLHPARPFDPTAPHCFHNMERWALANGRVVFISRPCEQGVIAAEPSVLEGELREVLQEMLR